MVPYWAVSLIGLGFFLWGMYAQHFTDKLKIECYLATINNFMRGRDPTYVRTVLGLDGELCRIELTDAQFEAVKFAYRLAIASDGVWCTPEDIVGYEAGVMAGLHA